MKLILAIDLGTTGAKVGLINQYGDIQVKFRVDNDPNDLIGNLYNKIIEGLEAIGVDYEEEVDKVGLATVGFIDHMSGIVKYSANLGWKNFDLKNEAKKVFKKQIFVLNDANAAALGEFWTGAGKQYDSIVFYTIGAGVGGAIILEGKLMSGSRGYAGEFGHGGKFQDKYLCSCGLMGCIEPMSSGPGIARLFKDVFEENKNHPAAIYFSEVEEITSKSILKIYEENERPAEIQDLLKEALRPVILHMSNMVSALDPEAIIVGGGISNMGDALVEIIKQEIPKYTIERFSHNITVEVAELGNDAGIVGAGYYALNDWKIY